MKVIELSREGESEYFEIVKHTEILGCEVGRKTVFGGSGCKRLKGRVQRR